MKYTFQLTVELDEQFTQEQVQQALDAWIAGLQDGSGDFTLWVYESDGEFTEANINKMEIK